MKSDYRTVLNYKEGEIIINKSRFIGSAKQVNSEEEALEFIDMVSEKYKDATHNVHAYLLGENSNIQRFSDDGEPSGTAGVPILELMKKEDLRNTVIVSTRYFGGIKLGTRGLVKAYGSSVNEVLEIAELFEYKKLITKTLVCEYKDLSQLEYLLEQNSIEISNKDFTTDVHLEIKLSDEEFESIKDLLSREIKIL